MSSAQPPIERQRVRRSRRKQSSRARRNPRIGQAIFGAMVLFTIGFVGFTLHAVSQAGQAYGPVGLEMTRADLRYLMGAPLPVAGSPAADAQHWTYRLPEGGLLRLDFDPGDGRVRSLSCEDEAAVPTSCPRLLDIPLGTPENTLWFRLGAPSRQQFAGDAKILVYDDLGATFVLKRYVVDKVGIARRQSGGFVAAALRTMVP